MHTDSISPVIQSGFLILLESEEEIFSRRIGLMVVDVLTFLKQLSVVHSKSANAIEAL